MLAGASVQSSSASPADSSDANLHRLRLYHTHTGEHIDIVQCDAGLGAGLREAAGGGHDTGE